LQLFLHYYKYPHLGRVIWIKICEKHLHVCPVFQASRWVWVTKALMPTCIYLMCIFRSALSIPSCNYFHYKIYNKKLHTFSYPLHKTKKNTCRK
jgi:hypothetical protein